MSLRDIVLDHETRIGVYVNEWAEEPYFFCTYEGEHIEAPSYAELKRRVSELFASRKKMDVLCYYNPDAGIVRVSPRIVEKVHVNDKPIALPMFYESKVFIEPTEANVVRLQAFYTLGEFLSTYAITDHASLERALMFGEAICSAFDIERLTHEGH